MPIVFKSIVIEIVIKTKICLSISHISYFHFKNIMGVIPWYCTIMTYFFIRILVASYDKK